MVAVLYFTSLDSLAYCFGFSVPFAPEGRFLLLQNFSVAISVSPHVLFYLSFNFDFCESSCLFYLSFNFDFCVSKIMHL